MNSLNIIIQDKNTPKNIKLKDLPEGMSIAIMEAATSNGQIALEFFIKNGDGYVFSRAITEKNFEGLMGAFLGCRARWGRLPENEFELVKFYIERALDELPKDGRLFTRQDIEEHLRLS